MLKGAGALGSPRGTTLPVESCPYETTCRTSRTSTLQTQRCPGPCEQGWQTDGATTWRELAQNTQDFASKPPDASSSFPSASSRPLRQCVHCVRGMRPDASADLRRKAGDLSTHRAQKSKVPPLRQRPRKPEFTGHRLESRGISENSRRPQQEPHLPGQDPPHRLFCPASFVPPVILRAAW